MSGDAIRSMGVGCQLSVAIGVSPQVSPAWVVERVYSMTLGTKYKPASTRAALSWYFSRCSTTTTRRAQPLHLIREGMRHRLYGIHCAALSCSTKLRIFERLST